MTTFVQLAALGRRTADIPPMVAGFVPALATDDEAEPHEDAAPGGADERADEGVNSGGVTLAIEYADSRGAGSRRRITVLRMRVGGAGQPMVDAWCHERKARRCFRFDRIRSIIDLDGVVHPDATGYFVGVLGVVPPWVAAATAPGAIHRRLAGDGARFLVALAHADGKMVVTEAQAIIAYMADRADLDGHETTVDDYRVLVDWITTLRPTRDQLDAAALALDRAPPIERRMILRAAVRVMDADGRQEPAEFAMVLEARDRFGG